MKKIDEAHANADRTTLAVAMADRIVDPSRSLEAYLLILEILARDDSPKKVGTATGRLRHRLCKSMFPYVKKKGR